jgi:hypothetical protein
VHVLATTNVNWGALAGGVLALLAAIFHGRWGTKQQLNSIAVTLDGQLSQAVSDVKALQTAVAHLEGYLSPSPLAPVVAAPVVVTVPPPPVPAPAAVPIPPPTG